MRGSRRNLVWFDASAGLLAGVITLIFSGPLSNLYRLPHGLLLLFAFANLGYGTYSTSLAVRQNRPSQLIVLLVIANACWAVFCSILAVSFLGSASILGIGHFVIEGFFVGGLALWEWRWRNFLA